MVPIEYFPKHYLDDLKKFDENPEIPSHGPFSLLCGMTMGNLFSPSRRGTYSSPTDFLCCLYSLNLVNQGIYTYNRNLHGYWSQYSVPFLDCRGCSHGHGGWTNTPNSILRFSEDPSFVTNAQPIEIPDYHLASYINYFVREYLPSIFERNNVFKIDIEDLFGKLKTDPNCSELDRLM